MADRGEQQPDVAVIDAGDGVAEVGGDAGAEADS
jgi:hypothetical protein